MKTISALGGGLAGALTLTLLHETLKRVDPDAPRLDALAQNALVKGLKSMNEKVPGKNSLFNMSLAGDLIGNAIYFSKIAGGTKQQVWSRGAMLGLGAGLGAVYLPKQFGLNAEPSNRTNKTKILTVALYFLGGLATAAAINLIEGKDESDALDSAKDKVTSAKEQVTSSVKNTLSSVL